MKKMLSQIQWLRCLPQCQPLLVIPRKQRQAFDKLINEENLSKEKTEKLIEDCLFAEKEPLTDDLLDLIEGEKPSILMRKKRRDGILLRIKDFVETFINGMVG